MAYYVHVIEQLMTELNMTNPNKTFYFSVSDQNFKEEGYWAHDLRITN